MAKRGQHHATIRDVAHRAGVSVGTVSRYLNGFSLRSYNRRKIEAAVEELGYTENFIAKGMKTRRTHAVGALVAGYDEFHLSVFKTVERELTSRGYTLMICDFDHRREVLEERAAFLLRRDVDGLVVSPIPGVESALRAYAERDIPVVMFNNDLPSIAADRVVVDNEDAAFRAVSYLLAMNHRRIGLITGLEGHSSAAERRDGYVRAHRLAGVDVDPDLLRHGDWRAESGYAAMRRILSLAAPPTAVFVANYLMTLGVLRAANEAEVRIPEDLSLLSFDDPNVFDVYRPAITAVRQPEEAIGRSIAELLLARLHGDRQESRTVRHTCNVILRGSVTRSTG